MGNFVELTTAMSVSEVIAAVTNQTVVGSVIPYVVNPCRTKSWVAIAASKLTSTIESNFQSTEVDILLWK